MTVALDDGTQLRDRTSIGHGVSPAVRPLHGLPWRGVLGHDPYRARPGASRTVAPCLASSVTCQETGAIPDHHKGAEGAPGALPPIRRASRLLWPAS